MMCRVKVILNYEAHSWNLSLLVKLGILQTSVYNVSMEARMSLLNVSQENSFCACAVLGKMALYDGLLYLR